MSITTPLRVESSTSEFFNFLRSFDGPQYPTLTPFPYQASRPEPVTNNISVELMLEGFGPVAAEFTSEDTVKSVQISLADQLGYFDRLGNASTGAVIVGPMVIPARQRRNILFASVRSVEEAETWGVHLYKDDADDLNGVE